MPGMCPDIDTVDNAIKQIDELCCYCRSAILKPVATYARFPDVLHLLIIVILLSKTSKGTRISTRPVMGTALQELRSYFMRFRWRSRKPLKYLPKKDWWKIVRHLFAVWYIGRSNSALASSTIHWFILLRFSTTTLMACERYLGLKFVCIEFHLSLLFMESLYYFRKFKTYFVSTPSAVYENNSPIHKRRQWWDDGYPYG